MFDHSDPTSSPQLDHPGRCTSCLHTIDTLLLDLIRAGRLLRIAERARDSGALDLESESLACAGTIRRMLAFREGVHQRLFTERVEARRLGVGKAAWLRIDRVLDRDFAEQKAAR